MTAGTDAGSAAGVASRPSVTLGEAQLADLELILSGALAPLRGFLDPADTAAVAERSELADGTPWPFPVTLDLPADAVPADASHLALQDPEGTPLAILEITGRTPGPEGSGLVRLAGPVTANRPPEHGVFRRLRLSPAETRARLGDGPVLACTTRGPLSSRQLGQLRHLAGQLRARILLLPLITGPAEVVRRPEALIRAVLAASASLPASTLVVPVPLAARGTGPGGELAAQAVVAGAYGATHLFADEPGTAGAAGISGAGTSSAGTSSDGTSSDGTSSDGAGPAAGTVIPLVSAGDWAYDPAAEVWRPLSLIESGTELTGLSDGELAELLDSGGQVPSWFMPPAEARELRRARPPRSERGFVLFLTGLSGSGKSTIARDLSDVLAERGDRQVSLLDGDLVRRLLSAGLTFSRADRDLNIARIGYVAAEIARHGGIAICAPIAPFAAARARVREMVSEVGDFLLVHVATPVEVCEARDRKGLYAQARAGLIDHFTGVSDPYEEPTDADLVIDTAVMSRPDAVTAVLALLAQGGWLAPAGA